MSKVKFHINGQWTLEKGAALKLDQPGAAPSLKDLVGTTHTVEIHPDIDHLYRAKGFIQDSNKPHLSIQHFKKAGFPEDIVKKMPRDANGRVTPEMIDKHIEGLPKKKVDVSILPYTYGGQQHRDGEQHVLTVNYSGNGLASMPEAARNLWNDIYAHQHDFHSDLPGAQLASPSHINQVGWSRVDGNTKPDHWHIDEIQSDFQNKKNLSSDKSAADDLFNHLSHGHDSPNHMIHSATNALARKLGVKSMSMDTPEDQAGQSSLLPEDNLFFVYGSPGERKLGPGARDAIIPLMGEGDSHDIVWRHVAGLIEGAIAGTRGYYDPEYKDPNLKTGLDKIGGLDALEQLARYAKSGSAIDLKSDVPNDMKDSIQSLTEAERDALNKILQTHRNELYEYTWDGIQDNPDYYEEQYRRIRPPKTKIPVHQMDTYSKKPKRLGMQSVPKTDLFSPDKSDWAKEVQYMKLHKKLSEFLASLKKNSK